MPPSRDLPDRGIKPMSPLAPALQADSLPPSHQGSPYVTLGKFKYLTVDVCYSLEQGPSEDHCVPLSVWCSLLLQEGAVHCTVLSRACFKVV